MRASMAAMRVIAGDPYMHSPDLRDQLSTIGVPALVVWGESDRIATPDYGRAFARAIPGASFELIERAGHLPQLERPAETFVTIDTWLATLSRP
jgi:pimeloyl-ACP methyl ester carboxylesterase